MFSSTETTWALFALATHPTVQQRLRVELLSVQTDTPSADELNELPYLDAVIRETLRVHAAVLSTLRVAIRDDIIPLSKPFTDRYGRTMSEIWYVEFQADFESKAVINGFSKRPEGRHRQHSHHNDKLI